VKKRIAVLSALFVLAVSVAWNPSRHKVRADTPIPLNPTMYECITDNQVVSRTTTYDPTNAARCDMVTSSGNSTTLLDAQAQKMVFSGSYINFAPLLVNGTVSAALNVSYEAALSGAAQVPVSVNGQAPPFTTLVAVSSLSRLNVVMNPPMPVGMTFFMQISNGASSQALTFIGDGVTSNAVLTASASDPWYFAAGSKMSLFTNFACDGGPDCNFQFTNFSWKTQ
jgi:hypothetical protein